MNGQIWKGGGRGGCGIDVKKGGGTSRVNHRGDSKAMMGEIMVCAQEGRDNQRQPIVKTVRTGGEGA